MERTVRLGGFLSCYNSQVSNILQVFANSILWTPTRLLSAASCSSSCVSWSTSGQTVIKCLIEYLSIMSKHATKTAVMLFKVCDFLFFFSCRCFAFLISSRSQWNQWSHSRKTSGTIYRNLLAAVTTTAALTDSGHSLICRTFIPKDCETHKWTESSCFFFFSFYQLPVGMRITNMLHLHEADAAGFSCESLIPDPKVHYTRHCPHIVRFAFLN